MKIRIRNIVLKKMSSLKKRGVTGDWRIFHDGDIHDL
jgi:hypothetical protein